MLAQFFRAVIVGLVATTLVRGIVLAFGLDEWMARTISSILRTANVEAAAWIVSGLFGLLAFGLWLAFGKKVADSFDRRPPLGSLHQVNSIVAFNRFDERTDIEIVVQLNNRNDELLKTRGELQATVNGKDLDQPIVFDGYANAQSTTDLIVRMRDIPFEVENSVIKIVARMRYNVFYHFPRSPSRTRRTSKLVQLDTILSAKGVPGSRTETRTNLLYFDEIEE